MKLSLSRRLVLHAFLSATASMAVHSPAAAFELAEDGKLTVAFTGDMPGSDARNIRLAAQGLFPGVANHRR